MMNKLKSYGVIKVLKNTTLHRRVKRHPLLQTKRMKRMMMITQKYMSQDQEGGQNHQTD
jgi:dissimilatory sulfite reductase (desulfoviridin) alpha/beta subunit